MYPDTLKEEMKEFLKNANLSNYEINVCLALMFSGNATAREISSKSRVPTGRIYEILESLRERGIIEVSESRPKLYRLIAPNLALKNLISHLDNEMKRKTAFLVEQAKLLEPKLYDLQLFNHKESSKVFWSTAFGVSAAFSLYNKKFAELQHELLMTGFINETTIKILKFATPFYQGIISAVERGVKVKYLWSFEHDERPLTDALKTQKDQLYKKLLQTLEEFYHLSSYQDSFEIKYIYKRIPTYYDIFDQRRVIIKLQNPMDASRIFACLNVLDPKLAEELRGKFLTLWHLKTEDESI